jgi:PadR family transcriptional regulator PadR
MTLATKAVLRALIAQDGETYVRQISNTAGLPSGTVAPILIRLNEAGWVEGRGEEGNPGILGRPLRRYYRLTDEGLKIATEATQ